MPTALQPRPKAPRKRGALLAPAQKLELVKCVAMLGQAFNLWRNDRTRVVVKVGDRYQPLRRVVEIRPNTGVSSMPYRWMVQVDPMYALGDEGEAQLRKEIERHVKTTGFIDYDLCPTATYPVAFFDGALDDIAGTAKEGSE